MGIFPIKAFNDNYIWALKKNNNILVVDPGDANPVLEFCENDNLTHILITHHHYDHTGGIKKLTEKFRSTFTYSNLLIV